MKENGRNGRRLVSALFVDFDNIIWGLEREDPDAAERFAHRPAEWLRWVESGMKRPAGPGGLWQRRDLLMRRCYLNPARYGRYRMSFTRAGFEVMDCPRLTTQGKNSADIRIVMDVLDAMNHPTRFDEFIIFSSDSDFTPVLMRLRAHDRRTTILTLANTAGAYRNAADLTIEVEDFIEEGLDLGASQERDRPVARGAEGVSQDLLARIGEKIYEKASIQGEIDPVDLPPIYKTFPEFTASENWLGFYSLRSMTENVTATHRNLRITSEDPWKVVVSGDAVAITDDGAGDRRPDAPGADPIGARAAAIVETMVRNSDGPVPMVVAAEEVRNRMGTIVTDSCWGGEGTFKRLLEGHLPEGIEISPVPPGYLFDSAIHTAPVEVQSRPDWLEEDPDLAVLVRSVHRITDIPILSHGQYRAVFDLIVEEVEANGYSLTRTSKAVRDRCSAEGQAIARQSIAFVLKGLSFSGYRFVRRPGANKPAELAWQFVENVADICENAGRPLSDAERILLERWLVPEIDREHLAG